MAGGFQLFKFDSQEKTFSVFCEFLEGNLDTLENIADWAVEYGYSRKDFLDYYYNHEEQINQKRRRNRAWHWSRVLNELADKSEPGILCFNAKELSYCMKYFTKDEIEDIFNELRSRRIKDICFSNEKPADTRRIAKALVKEKIQTVIELGKSYPNNNHISYISYITTLFYDYPFLQKEQVILFNYLEKQGIIIDGKPDISELPRQTRAYYFTEEERLEALKNSQEKYKKKTNKPNTYNIDKTINRVDIGRFDNWDYDQDLDTSKYRSRKDQDY